MCFLSIVKMEVSIVTVVLLIGCATLVYADWRPGPAGKQKITSIIIGFAHKVGEAFQL